MESLYKPWLINNGSNSDTESPLMLLEYEVAKFLFFHAKVQTLIFVLRHSQGNLIWGRALIIETEFP